MIRNTLARILVVTLILGAICGATGCAAIDLVKGCATRSIGCQ